MGMVKRVLHFFGLTDEDQSKQRQKQEHEYEDEDWFDEEDDLQLNPSNWSHSSSNNVVRLQSAKNHTKMFLIEPRSYDESQEIADHLKRRCAVVLNLQRLHHDQAKRVVDFLSGTVYAIGGEIQKVGSNIFLCTPDNVDIQGSITEIIPEEIQSRMR